MGLDKGLETTRSLFTLKYTKITFSSSFLYSIFKKKDKKSIWQLLYFPLLLLFAEKERKGERTITIEYKSCSILFQLQRAKNTFKFLKSIKMKYKAYIYVIPITFYVTIMCVCIRGG